MRSIIAVSLLFATVALAQVVDLTPENFDAKVFDSSSLGAFVEFYAPWCGHCKNLAPAYEVVGESFGKQNVLIAKVDCDAHKDLGSRFDVHGFPTLKWFPAGSKTPEDYNGGRSAEDIINFINGKAGTNVRVKKAPSNVVDLDTDNFDKLVLESNKDVLVEFYAPWCGHCKKLIPDYEKVASIFAGDSSVAVAKIDADAHRDIGSRYGVTGFPTLMWFSKNDKQNPEKYERGRDVESFVSFINEKAGTQRLTTGRLQATAGRIESLDAIASKFVGSSDQAALVKEAEAAVAQLSKADAKNGSYYVKVMTTIQSKGKDFVDTEVARLNKLMDGSVAAAKVDEFTIRQNILKAFKP